MSETNHIESPLQDEALPCDEALDEFTRRLGQLRVGVSDTLMARLERIEDPDELNDELGQIECDVAMLSASALGQESLNRSKWEHASRRAKNQTAHNIRVGLVSLGLHPAREDGSFDSFGLEQRVRKMTFNEVFGIFG